MSTRSTAALLLVFVGALITPSVDGAAAPSLRVLSPIEGDTIGSALIIGGEGSGIDNVSVQLDDGEVVGASGTDAWSFALDLLGQSAGSHTLTIRATSTAGPLMVLRNVTYDPIVPTSLELEQQLSPLRAQQGQTVLISGFVRTSQQARLQEGFVQVRIGGLPSVANGSIDLLGSFTVALKAPAQSGSLTLTTTVDAPTLNLSVTGTLPLEVAPPTGPDVAIEELQQLTAVPVSNLTLNLSARLRNNGSEPAAVTMRLYDGPPSADTLVQRHDLTLPPGVEVQQLQLTPRAAGVHHLVVNLTIATEDPQRSNNERFLDVDVEARPRLIVNGLLLATDQPQQDHPISMRVGISNGGDATATCRLAIEAQRIDASGKALAGNAPQLVVSKELVFAPGEERILSGSGLDPWMPTTGGRWQLRAQVLATAPADPDTSDDVATISVEVEGTPEQPQRTSLPSLSLLLGALAIGVLLAQRRRTR